MTATKMLRQPWLGVVGTLLCVVLSLAICTLFDAVTFGTWVTLVLVSMVPAQIILSLVWKNNFPLFIKSMTQPTKGMALIAVTLFSGAIVTPVIIWVLGGGITPPTPYPIMYAILSVVITIWFVVVMHCWPMTSLSENSAVVGIGVWLLAYIVAYIIFIAFFNYQFLQGTPVYFSNLDPQGFFNAWHSLSFSITALLVIDIFILMDFWPFSLITVRINIFSKQPFLGMLNTAIVLMLAYIIWYCCIVLLQMDTVVFMVKIAVSTIFGVFVMLLMMQMSPAQSLEQPLKGLVLLTLAVFVSVVMYRLYRSASGFILGPLPAGGPEYQLELWLASAMLAVTFPLLVVFGEFFGFWPLIRTVRQTIDEKL